MQISVQSLKKRYVVVTVVVQLYLKSTQFYFFPILISAFGNEKQRRFVISYFWKNTDLTAFWGWFHSIHVEDMKEAYPGKFLLSWINLLMRILVPHFGRPVRVSEARYSLENNSITYLLISQPVTYLGRRPDSSQLAKALPEALLLHNHPYHSPCGKQKMKYLQRVSHTTDGLSKCLFSSLATQRFSEETDPNQSISYRCTRAVLGYNNSICAEVYAF